MDGIVFVVREEGSVALGAGDLLVGTFETWADGVNRRGLASPLFDIEVINLAENSSSAAPKPS